MCEALSIPISHVAPGPVQTPSRIQTPSPVEGVPHGRRADRVAAVVAT